MAGPWAGHGSGRLLGKDNSCSPSIHDLFIFLLHAGRFHTNLVTHILKWGGGGGDGSNPIGKALNFEPTGLRNDLFTYKGTLTLLYLFNYGLRRGALLNI